MKRPDPLDSMWSFGDRAARKGMIVGCIVAAIAHGSVAVRAAMAPLAMRMWAEQTQAQVKDYLWAQYDVEVQKPPTVAPQPEPPSLPDPEPPVPVPIKAPPRAQAPDQHDEPAPAAAQAGQILSAPQDPNEPLDLTKDEFVTGTADSYVGGVTAPAGTGTTPTYNRAASPTGVPGATGTAKSPPPPVKPVAAQNLTRTATIASGVNWSNCPFPPQADIDQVDYAQVTLMVTVRPDGTAQSVRVLTDPGHGFGRAASRCAMSKKYAPALNAQGKAVLGTTPPIRVTFTR